MAKSDHDLGGSLRYRREQRNGLTWIALSGNINETANFTPLKSVPGPLVLDLGNIDRINSLGVRAWIHFVRDRELAGVEMTFERCSPVMVNQMSMITRFMGSRSRVKSVLVPYICPSCSHEHHELVEVSPSAAIEPKLPCPKCGSQMDLDELADTYTELLGGA